MIKLITRPPLRKMICTVMGILYANAALFKTEIAVYNTTCTRYGVRGTRLGLILGIAKPSGPRSKYKNFRIPCKETRRNWVKVMRDPIFGYSEVSSCKLIALL